MEMFAFLADPTAYVALFTLSSFALIYGLLGIDAAVIRQQFHDRTPVKWISGYLLLIAAGLGGTPRRIASSIPSRILQQIVRQINRMNVTACTG